MHRRERTAIEAKDLIDKAGKRIIRLMAKSHDKSERKHLIRMVECLAMANFFSTKFPRTKRKEEFLEAEEAREAYSNAKEASEIIRFTRASLEREFSNLEAVTEEEALHFSEMATNLSVSLAIANSLAKAYYVLGWEKGETSGFFESEKWKGRYSVCFYNQDGSLAYCFDGPSDMASALGISLKAARNRLSSIFPGKAGKAIRDILIGEKRFSVYFILDQDI